MPPQRVKMGALTSRQNAGVEEVDIGINHAYRYPPKAGSYFSTHFIMGGERFDTAQPEMYLFGENMDVNFLGSRPAPFPYPAPQANEPSKTLKALINIRKESLRFVRTPDDSAALKDSTERPSGTKFNLEFTFDTDVRCAITIMYFCTEEVTTNGAIYTPRDPSMNSETYHYKRGANQQFSQVSHIFDPSQYPEEDLLYSFDKEVIPCVIYCLAEEGEEPRQSHATFAIIEKHTDGYVLKPLKQKLYVDGLSYLLQEIYGIENKSNETSKVGEDDTEDNGAECVICMCDLRDTLILPCRHLCLCNCCADSLRYQANNCPICRAPFRALLQIKALQKATNPSSNPQPSTEGGENIPAGYEAVSLIEALNGPSASPPQQPTAPAMHEMYVQLPQNAADAPNDATPILNDSSSCYVEGGVGVGSSGGVNNTLEDSTTQTDRVQTDNDNSNAPIPEMRMSVLLAQESEDLDIVKTEASMNATPIVTSKKRSGKKQSRDKQHYGSKDSLKVVNEMGEVQLGKEVDPGECHSLLDEDGCESGDSEVKTSRSLLGLVGSAGHRGGVEELGVEELQRAPQATTDTDDEDDDQQDHYGQQTQEDLVVSSDPSNLDLPYGTLNDEDDDDEENEDREVSLYAPDNAPSAQHKIGKNHRHRSTSSSQQSDAAIEELGITPICPGSPSGSNSSITRGRAGEPVSLPGTPLSNSSAVSRSSDASVSSASSTKALLAHGEGSPGSVV